MPTGNVWNGKLVLKEKYKLIILIISEKGIMHNMSEKPNDD